MRPALPLETSANGLVFQCDAKHSCDDDNLAATNFGLYATDQVDLTDKWKLRAGIRQDWFDTSLTPLITVPGRFDSEGEPLLGGVNYTRHDSPLSWNVGMLYRVLPGVSPYVGVSESHLSNFNSENTQNGIGAPEEALQYEAGVKFSLLKDNLTINAAAFEVTRNNVAAAVSIGGIESVVFDSQRTKGVEASVDAKITQQWHLLANATAQNAMITDNPRGITSVGNHPQGVPATMANLWTTYDFAIGGVPGFQVGAGFNYRDKTYSDMTNVNSVPSFIIGNAEFSYHREHWDLSINVHNISNERFFVAANGAGGFVGEGRSVYLTANYHY